MEGDLLCCPFRWSAHSLTHWGSGRLGRTAGCEHKEVRKDWVRDKGPQDSLGYSRRVEPRREGEEVAGGEMYSTVSV